MHGFNAHLRGRKGMLILSHQAIENMWGRPSQRAYTIPLIELIIRKGTGRLSRERVKIVHGQYQYKPSQSYINYMNKLYPLSRKNIT
jgi:hypothetical protein